jgi:hypothetical protein
MNDLTCRPFDRIVRLRGEHIEATLSGGIFIERFGTVRFKLGGARLNQDHLLHHCSAGSSTRDDMTKRPKNEPVPRTIALKAARTVVALTERLDHHRGRGQQQITVKHVTTNNVTADQAIIADSVTTGGASRNVPSPALLAVGSKPLMPILNEAGLPELIGVGGVENKK